MMHWRRNKSAITTIPPRDRLNSGVKSRQLSIPGEIGGGVLFASVIIAPLLIVAGIYFAYLTIVPELVQH